MEIGIWVSIGTIIILGFQTWIFLRQTKIINSQKEMSENQHLYRKRKETPKIEIIKKDYNNDKIHLRLHNKGGTKAEGIALKTEIYIINPEVKKENGKTLVSTRGDWDVNKQSSLKDEKESYSIGSTIFEIFNDKSIYPELEPNQEETFSNEAYFGLYQKKDQFPTPSKNTTFKSLLTLLKNNDVIICEINVSLIYKNLLNEVVEEVPIDSFCISPKKMKSKFLSEINKKDRLTGGMKFIQIHPFKKQDYNLPKSEKAYRKINHCRR